MPYLLDTNVMSESSRPEPNRRVLTWVLQNGLNAYVSALSLGEIWKGIQQLKDGRRKRAYREWFESQVADLQDRILPADLKVMKEWGDYVAEQKRKGRDVSALDSLLAATVLAHGLTLATRNTSDFPGVPTVNPWGE